MDVASINQLQRCTMDILNRQSEFFYMQWDYHTEVLSAFHPLWSVLRNDLLKRLIDRSVSSGVALEENIDIRMPCVFSLPQWPFKQCLQKYLLTYAELFVVSYYWLARLLIIYRLGLYLNHNRNHNHILNIIIICKS